MKQSQKFCGIKYFSVTCDICFEMMTCRSFLGVTVHYIEDSQLTSICIAVNELSEQHTAEYIGTKLLDILHEWRIDQNKVVAFITDNGANMIKANTENFRKDKHIACFAHCLNLIVGRHLL